MRDYVAMQDLYYQLSMDYDINLSGGEYNSIIKKLEKDGHLKISNHIDELERGTTHYILTFEGLFFISKGGYTQEKINKEQERIKKQNEKNQSDILSNRGVYWTKVASLVGVLFLLLEVWKYFHPDCPK